MQEGPRNRDGGQRERVEAIRARLCSGDGFAPLPLDYCRRSIPSVLADRAREAPDGLAVEAADRCFTYGELAALAGGVGARLLESEGAQEAVALVMEKGALPIAAMVGALAANRFFVPIDPSYPDDRFAFILKDSGARTVMTDSANLSLVHRRLGGSGRIVNVDEVEPGDPSLDLGSGAAADSLAYLIYTSGSTGQPKGVCQTQGNVIHFSRDVVSTVGLRPGRRHSVLGSYSFAQSASDIWAGLLSGACLLPFDLRKEGLTELARWLRDARVQSLHTMPTILRRLLGVIGEADDFPDLGLVWLGSEPTTRADVLACRKRFARECVICVTLGATEINAARFYLLDQGSPLPVAAVPIGYGFDEVDVVVLGEDGAEIAPGEIGQLAIKSRYLTPGYWRRPELNAAAFVPSAQGEGVRLYLTGDLGVKAEDGCVTHCGRKDFRARIRGHRVEVTEVEAALLTEDAVREAAVMARGEGQQYLAAYVVLKEGRTDTPAGLRRRLAQTLPDFMIPSAFVFMDALPLTPNGKLDRRALPEPGRERPLPSETYVSPTLTLECELVRAWEATLGIRGIGIRDDFFELGGDSMRGAVFLARLEGMLGRQLSPDLLYRFPTIAELVAELAGDKGGGRASPLVTVQPHGRRRPVFFAAHMHGWMYRDLSNELGREQPFYALRPVVPLDAQPGPPNLRKLASEYIDAVKAVQPHGPYILGGMSATGFVAYEMAQQLFRRGEQVALLVLLDTIGRMPAWSGPLKRRMMKLRAKVLRFLHMGPGEQLKALLASGRGLYSNRSSMRQVRLKPGRRPPQRDARLDELVRSMHAAYRRAARRYAPFEYPGRIAYFLARDALPRGFLRDSRLDWCRLAGGGYDVYRVPGNHFQMLTGEGVREVARRMKSALDSVQ